jgi:hypothetical protein
VTDTTFNPAYVDPALPAFTDADHQAVAAAVHLNQTIYDARKTALAHAITQQANNDLPGVDDDYEGDGIDQVHDVANRHLAYLLGELDAPSDEAASDEAASTEMTDTTPLAAAA